MVAAMSDALAVALSCAHAAGEILASLYRSSDFSIATKSSEIDLVTTADRAADEAIVTRLRAAFPDHAILAEESGATAGRQPGLQWVGDPLDGTTNFPHGVPHFSVSIGLYDGDRGEVGVVHDPLRGETFCARRGEGCWLVRSGQDKSPLRVTPTAQLGRALLATGFAYTRSDPRQKTNLDEFAATIPKVRGIRRAGSAALDLAYVAAGRLDGYWEYHLQPWDTGAGAVLVREAGGIVTTIAGTPWAPTIPSLAAAGPKLHAPLLAHLRQFT